MEEYSLNVTWDGTNGDLQDPVSADATDAQIREWASEAVRNGNVPGIATDPDVNFSDFVVDRYPPKIFLRPKVPFGDKV